MCIKALLRVYMCFCNFFPSCKQAGPRGHRFTRRGVINILPPFTAPKDDRAHHQAQVVLNHLHESTSHNRIMKWRDNESLTVSYSARKRPRSPRLNSSAPCIQTWLFWWTGEWSWVWWWYRNKWWWLLEQWLSPCLSTLVYTLHAHKNWSIHIV